MATHPTRSDIDLLDGSFYVDDPHEKYTWMRENAPVYFDAENGVWGIASYAALLAMEKDPHTFSNAGGIRPDNGPIPMMIDMDDPEHWKRRKLVNKGFTPRRVRDSEQKIRDVCDAIIDTVCEKGECDFVNDIAAPLPMILIGDMLGVEPEDRDDLLQWSDDMVSAQSGNATDEQYVKAMNAMEGYSAFCTHAVAQRQAQPTDDLMSVLVHAEVDGDRLSPDDVLHESLLILVGGDETTRHVISGGVEQLLLNPDQRQLLVDDPSKITVAVEEMLRWVTPIKNMCRTVTHDTEFMGQPMTAGQKCMLLFESANRDSTRFDDPFRFDVERDPNEHLAFGFGAHFCLGQALARLELKVMFEQLLVRLPDLELAADSAELPRRRANFISGLESMPVRFSPSPPLLRSTV
ncbi:MAG TPA: cytochrome P450 [Acidimicrobiia bacterium]|jgi:cytochrome P450 family 142 subfamily A polypeptide 1|nr:cytochrome P450 [Acidimicrobiia bacterium]